MRAEVAVPVRPPPEREKGLCSLLGDLPPPYLEPSRQKDQLLPKPKKLVNHWPEHAQTILSPHKLYLFLLLSRSPF